MRAPALLLIDEPAAGGTAGFVEAPHDAPVVRAMNFAVTRGDGIFETVGVHDGVPHDVEPHLDRFELSARMLELPEPSRDAYRAAIARAVELINEDGTPPTAFVKCIMTRGVEGTDAGPTGWVYAGLYPDMTPVRTTPARMVTLTSGFALGIGAEAPWLLLGAKTLSYATNMAAKREAVRRGADEALLITTDGYVLEGPQSNLLVRHGDRIVTPAPDGGLLHGTAQRAGYDFFASQGLSTEYGHVPVASLADADGIWITNSVQLVRPIGWIDGNEIPFDADLTAGLVDYLVRRPDGS